MRSSLLVLLLCGVTWTVPVVAQAPTQPAQKKCALECATLTSRLALALEYDLCEATEALRVAHRDNRVVERRHVANVDASLSDSSKCIEAKAGPQLSVYVVQKLGEKGLATHKQAPSADLQILRACLAPFGKADAVRAHRDLTGAALEALYGKGKGGLAALASEQADAYAWTLPKAHAQTPDGGDRMTARDDFKTYFSKTLEQMRKRCCVQDPTGVAYHLGYVMHALQDLSTHEGMTNTRHSWLIRHGRNPDLKTAKLDRAVNWSKALLAKLRGTALGTCVEQAAGVVSDGANWDELGKHYRDADKDGSPGDMLEFLGLGLLDMEPPAGLWPNVDKLVTDELEPMVTAAGQSACP